jgi:hypothetical protein
MKSINKDRYQRPIPSQPYKDEPMRRFSEHVDREHLQMFLHQSGNDRYETLALMMGDPAFAGLTFATLCKKNNITLHEMQMLYTDGMRQLALLKMSNALPDLMMDVAEDAKSKMEACPRCDGQGIVPDTGDRTKDCPACQATGKIRRIGDRHARDLVFESAKLTKQTGPLVAIQNITTGDSHLEAILKKTRAIVLDKPNMPMLETSHDETKTV